MKEQKEAPQEEEGFVERGFKKALLIGTLAAAALAEEGCAPARNDSDSNAPSVPEHRESAVPERNMTPDEVKQFWGNQLHVIKELTESQQYPIPEIREYYLKAQQDILNRYGKEVYMQVTVNYAPISRDVIGGSSALGDGPKLGIFTPALRDIWENSKNSTDPKWKEKFDNLSLVALMHELDHLASGYVLTPTNADTSLEGRVLREKKAWALTCENTMEPLVRNGKQLEHSDQIRYDAWIKAGRDVNSPLWEEFIRRLHDALLPKSAFR